MMPLSTQAETNITYKPHRARYERVVCHLFIQLLVTLLEPGLELSLYLSPLLTAVDHSHKAGQLVLELHLKVNEGQLVGGNLQRERSEKGRD